MKKPPTPFSAISRIWRTISSGSIFPFQNQNGATRYATGGSPKEDCKDIVYSYPILICTRNCCTALLQEDALDVQLGCPVAVICAVPDFPALKMPCTCCGMGALAQGINTLDCETDTNQREYAVSFNIDPLVVPSLCVVR